MIPVVVYDTTLRDGMQGEGMSLSVEEKVRVARILDSLGVPMIEAGFPTSNPKELELFERLSEAGLTAAVCAFGMTRRRGVQAAEDAALRVLAESWTPVSTIVVKTRGLHLEKVVKVDREENLVRTDLYNADECFFTGTAAELTPIREVDDHVVGDGTRGPITTEIQAIFEDALHGRSERYADWLDRVPAAVS